MTNKYYTPELSEFHVGFEYEWSENGKKIWIEECADVDDVLLAYSEYEHEDYPGGFADVYRIKYLDQQDIEECGFEFRASDDLRDSFYSNIVTDICFFRESKRVIIYGKGGDDDLLFHGEIKNKSEFKKLLKQLGI